MTRARRYYSLRKTPVQVQRLSNRSVSAWMRKGNATRIRSVALKTRTSLLRTHRTSSIGRWTARARPVPNLLKRSGRFKRFQHAARNSVPKSMQATSRSVERTATFVLRRSSLLLDSGKWTWSHSAAARPRPRSPGCATCQQRLRSSLSAQSHASLRYARSSVRCRKSRASSGRIWPRPLPSWPRPWRICVRPSRG